MGESTVSEPQTSRTVPTHSAPAAFRDLTLRVESASRNRLFTADSRLTDGNRSGVVPPHGVLDDLVGTGRHGAQASFDTKENRGDSWAGGRGGEFAAKHVSDAMEFVLRLPLGAGDPVYLSPLRGEGAPPPEEEREPTEEFRGRLAPMLQRCGARAVPDDRSKSVY